MRNIQLTIEYDGSKYNGWSRQGKETPGTTLSTKITDTLQRITGESIDDLICAYRTETGVHAYAQIANFKTLTNISIDQFKQELNRFLPMDIAITDVNEVRESFHSGLNAVTKSFLYRMIITEVPSVFDRKHCFHCYIVPNKKHMEEGASKLLGEHDFKNFSTSKSSKSTIRCVKNIDIFGNDDEMQILLCANDFLYNMPRAIIGTLLDIGTGKSSPEIVDSIFSGKQKVPRLCDPKGLYLSEITY